MNASEFRALVSGRRRGIGATLARAGLRLAEVPYTLVVEWRNRRFDAGRDCHRVEVPVVSVGNLTLGGTGKTPMVAWLARWFRERGVRVTLVSRGYGASPDGRNDEALELEEILPDVPHLQNRDRVAAAQLAIEEFECQLILLDDGFQHRRLDRDLDIVLLDALEPFGFGHVFPRGMLREPIRNLERADVVVLSRADAVDEGQRRSIRGVVERHAPEAVWVEARHRPQGLLGAGGRATAPLESLAGRRVAAFCGIGNPAGFRRTLESIGCVPIELREFPDHHAYQRSDIEELKRWSQMLDAEVVLCTHKDLVKIGLERLGERPLWALAIGLEVLVGREELEAQLRPLLPSDSCD